MKQFLILSFSLLWITAYNQLIVDPVPPVSVNPRGSIKEKVQVAASIPPMSSNVNAIATIFLDFDGGYITNTSWNWSGPINASDAGLSLDQIIDVFHRVSEDYVPFDVNVTTDSTKYNQAPKNKRIRILISRSNEWYGNAGGVAYVGSFSWNDDTPVWVFSKLHNYNTKNIGEAASHEAGHSLGLQHQAAYDENCNLVSSYNWGVGTGEISWGPIMGAGYNVSLTTWHRGPDPYGCTRIQDDFQILKSILGLKPDDHGNTRELATKIQIKNLNINTTGILNEPGDVDCFKVSLTNRFKISLNLFSSECTNSDLKLRITNGSNESMLFDPHNTVVVKFDTLLNPGEYVFSVSGSSDLYSKDDYGSLGDYTFDAQLILNLPVVNFKLNGSDTNGKHKLEWSYDSDEKVRDLTIESSTDGTTFRTLTVVDSKVRTFFNQSLRTTFYRVKARGEFRDYYSNTISIQNKKIIQVLSNLVSSQLEVETKISEPYVIFNYNGQIVLKGTLSNGFNRIDMSRLPPGVYVLKIEDLVEKITKL